MTQVTPHILRHACRQFALTLALAVGPVALNASAVEPRAVVPASITGVEGTPLYISAVGSVVDPGRKLEWKPDADSPELAGLVKLNTDDLPAAVALWAAPTVKPTDKIKKSAAERFTTYRVRVVAKGVPPNQTNDAKELDADSAWIAITITAKDYSPAPPPPPPDAPATPDDGTPSAPVKPLPAPASPYQASGRSYGADQIATYADTWVESATLLAAGNAKADVNASFAARWQARRNAKFAPVAASFARVVPDNVEPVGPARDALAQAWREFASGLKESIR